MRKKIVLIILFIIFITGTLFYGVLNEKSIESRIVQGNFYKSSTEKTSEIISLSLNPQNYKDYKNGGKRKFLIKKYDTKVYLEPIINKDNNLWITLYFVNNWWRISGSCFTFRDIKIENGVRVYSDINPNLQVTDQNNMIINGQCGGGGSTYSYGFTINKQVFENCKTINIKLSNFNIIRYKINLR